MGLLGATWTHVFTRARGEDESLPDVKIKPQIGNVTRRCEWRHAPEAWAEIWEKSVSWVFASGEGWLSELTEALQWVPHVVVVVVGRWKSLHRNIVYLSPYVEKPFNSKIIKSFVPELRSRKCFWVPGFLCYLYICVMDTMNVLRTGINMSISCIICGWLCNITKYVDLASRTRFCRSRQS